MTAGADACRSPEGLDIDPRQHTLMIHGLVDRPLTFTMDDLKRLPSVTRLHFIECAGNRSSPRAKTVQESHGMTSCAAWTLSPGLAACSRFQVAAIWIFRNGSTWISNISNAGRCGLTF